MGPRGRPAELFHAEHAHGHVVGRPEKQTDHDRTHGLEHRLDGRAVLDAEEIDDHEEHEEGRRQDGPRDGRDRARDAGQLVADEGGGLRSGRAGECIAERDAVGELLPHPQQLPTGRLRGRNVSVAVQVMAHVQHEPHRVLGEVLQKLPGRRGVVRADPEPVGVLEAHAEGRRVLRKHISRERSQ